MRLFLIFYFIFGILPLKSQTTQYTILYDFKWITDTSSLTYSDTEEYILFRIGKESRFLNSYAYHNDTIYYNYKIQMGDKINTQKAVDIGSQIVSPRLKHFTSALRLSKDFKAKTSTTILYETSNRHYLKEPLQLQWKMIPGIDTIVNIACYKAITQHGGRQYTAWYAPQIPIQDGPYIFHGLPGLITKVVDSDKWYSFEIRNFETNPNKKYSMPPFITQSWKNQINRATYVKNSRKEKEDPVYRVHYERITPEILAALREKRKSRFDLIIEKQ
jgi:GLPGLI family protein